jgi:hypothetical protein
LTFSGDAPTIELPHTERHHMKNLKAPLAVLIVGSIASIYFGEPGAIVLVAVLASLGYMINKADNA